MQNKRNQSTFFSLLIVIIALSINPVFSQNSKFTKITNYAIGSESFRLNKIPAQVKLFVPLKGFSSFKYLKMNVRSRYADHSVQFSTKNNKAFSVKYIMSSGPGNYTFTIYGAKSANARSATGIARFKVMNLAKVRPSVKMLNVNPQIMKYVKGTIGRQVGRGECWDVAQEALDLTGAAWKRTIGYGKVLNWKKDKIKPGDIIQFRQFVITRRTTIEGVKNGKPYKGVNTRTLSYGAPDHTSIVWEVLDKGHYKVAHQNVNGVRKMLVEKLDLRNASLRGSIRFFRPVAGLIFP